MTIGSSCIRGPASVAITAASGGHAIEPEELRDVVGRARLVAPTTTGGRRPRTTLPWVCAADPLQQHRHVLQVLATDPMRFSQGVHAARTYGVDVARAAVVADVTVRRARRSADERVERTDRGTGPIPRVREPRRRRQLEHVGQPGGRRLAGHVGQRRRRRVAWPPPAAWPSPGPSPPPAARRSPGPSPRRAASRSPARSPRPGSVGVVASVLNIVGIGLRRCVATLACIGCRRCIACVACIDCVDCIGCVGCVGLRGAVGQRGVRA